jgi:hypothetical protein
VGDETKVSVCSAVLIGTDVRLQVSSMVEANKAGILAEIKRLGEGIVSSVDVVEHE